MVFRRRQQTHALRGAAQTDRSALRRHPSCSYISSTRIIPSGRLSSRLVRDLDRKNFLVDQKYNMNSIIFVRPDFIDRCDERPIPTQNVKDWNVGLPSREGIHSYSGCCSKREVHYLGHVNASFEHYSRNIDHIWKCSNCDSLISPKS